MGISVYFKYNLIPPFTFLQNACFAINSPFSFTYPYQICGGLEPIQSTTDKRQGTSWGGRESIALFLFCYFTKLFNIKQFSQTIQAPKERQLYMPSVLIPCIVFSSDQLLFKWSMD